MTNENVPQEVKGWNWGAFWLTWIWGIKFNVTASFLALVPVVNYIMPFVLGLEGNKMAWKKKKWDSVEQFKAEQRRWSIYGWITFVVLTVLIFILLTFAL